MNEPKPLAGNAGQKTENGGQPVEDGPVPIPAEAANKLSPEEQMALYEQDLKEKDWGHQPC